MPADRPPAQSKYRRATGVDDANAQRWLLDQVTNALWFPPEATSADRRAIVKSAIRMLETIAPTDGIEGMLAAQMVAIHAASMESSRRAMNDATATPAQTVDPIIRDRFLRQASRLTAVFSRQLAALHAHRAEKRAAEWGSYPPYVDKAPTKARRTRKAAPNRQLGLPSSDEIEAWLKKVEKLSLLDDPLPPKAKPKKN